MSRESFGSFDVGEYNDHIYELYRGMISRDGECKTGLMGDLIESLDTSFPMGVKITEDYFRGFPPMELLDHSRSYLGLPFWGNRLHNIRYIFYEDNFFPPQVELVESSGTTFHFDGEFS